MSEILTGAENIESGLDNTTRQEIITGLMRGEKVDTGVMYKWKNEDMPEINGHKKYEDFCKNPIYQEVVVLPEMNLIKKHKKTIEKFIKNKRTKQLWDRGPGNEKAKKFSKLFYPDGVNDSLKYFPVDISEIACTEAREEMKDEGYKTTKKYVDSFFDTEMSAEAKGPLHLCLGLTASNFGSLDKIVKEMRTRDHIVKPKVIMSYGVAPNNKKDRDKLKAAYGDPDTNNPSYCEEAYKSMWFLMKHTFIALGFDTEKLELCVDYIDGEGVKIGMKVKSGEKLRMDVNGVTYEKTDKDGPIRFFCSEKDTKEKAEALLQESKQIGRNGLKVSDTDNGVGLLVFEKPNALPALRAKNSHRAKHALLGVLIGGGIMLGYNEYQDYKYEKKIDAKIINNMKYKFDGGTAQITYGGEMFDLSSDAGKFLFIKGLVNDLYEDILVRYKDFSLPDKDKVINALMLTLSEGDNLKYFINVNTSGRNLLGENKIHFLDHVFWPVFLDMSAEIENISLYEHLMKYESAMKSTLRLDDDFKIDSNKSIQFLQKDISDNKFKINELGKYIRSDGGNYKIAQVSVKDQNYFVAHRYWDDQPINEYSTLYGKEVILDYFKKGYADQLATKILDLMRQKFEKKWTKDENPNQMLGYGYNHLSGGPFETPVTAISSIITQINIDGYDVSFLLDKGNEELISRFVEEFFPKYYHILSEDQKHTLNNYVNIDYTAEVPLADALEHMSIYLNKYYITSDKTMAENLVLLQNELLKEMLLTPDKQYLNCKTDDTIFKYLYERKDVCKKYGFQLKTWKEFENFEKGFHNLLISKKSGEPPVNPLLYLRGNLNYFFQNLYRMSDGRVFIVFNSGDNHPVALELTKDSESAKKNLSFYVDDLNKGLLRATNYGKSAKHYQKIMKYHFTPTYDAAKIVARDYITQKYITPHSGKVVNHLIDKYSSFDMDSLDMGTQIKLEKVLNNINLQYDLEKIVENRMFDLCLESELFDNTIENNTVLSALEYTTAKRFDERVDANIFPEIKDDLDLYFVQLNEIIRILTSK